MLRLKSPWLGTRCLQRRPTTPVLRRCLARTPAKADAPSIKVDDNKAYSKTLLLPKTGFVLWSDPSRNEVFRARTCDELYQWQWDNAKGPVYVLHDGPPYANGELHLGHALNKIIKDIINRYHVSLGHRVHYHPGWDCHGLPIENKVLKKLGKGLGEVSSDTIRAEAEAYAKQEVQSQMNQFKEFGIMANWSKETTYRTMDHDYELRQLRIFQTMVEKGLIYRNHRPVYYSPSSRSALAEAELDYNEQHVSHSVYVSFELDLHSPEMSTSLRTLIDGRNNARLLVWTTTPWTLTANMAVAVHPDMLYKAVAAGDSPSSPLVLFAAEREAALRDVELPEVVSSGHVVGELKGSELVGAAYRPLFSPLLKHVKAAPSLPIVPSGHVTTDAGTGLVHCAPAHGAEDYLLFRSLGLLSASSTDLLCHVDSLGCFTAGVSDVVGDQAAGPLVGKEVLTEGGKAIIVLLREVNALSKVQRIKHRYPYDWKTDKPVITVATSQWFANLDNIKNNAIAAIKDVMFVPGVSRHRLEAFIRSRSEWCISRQRVWGVPIPALYHIPSDRAVLDSASLAHILGILGAKGTAYWWCGPVSEFVPPALREDMSDAQLAETWRKGTDTLDVWFDSGTSWSMLHDVHQKHGTGEEARTFGADVCVEGSDQHRGWFQSQLLTSVASAESEERRMMSPYGTLITHGMVLDEKGKKMSKSLGNIISPMSVIYGGKDKKKEPEYGAEVLRLWTATMDLSKDMSIGPTVLSQIFRSYRKIRGTARFILGALEDKHPEQPVDRSQYRLIERFVMHELYKLDSGCRDAYANYDFPRVVYNLSQFVNITMSSLYLDIVKDCLYANAKHSLERRIVLDVLDRILTTITHVMKPILPYLAEEIFETIGDAKGSSVFARAWTPLGQEWQDEVAEREMKNLLRARQAALAAMEEARQAKLLKSSLEAEVLLLVPEGVSETNSLLTLLRREEDLLKTLFITSDAYLTDEGSLGTKSPGWLYSRSIPLQEGFSAEGSEHELRVLVRPASLHKCPRCWTFRRPEVHTLCKRCSDVLAQ